MSLPSSGLVCLAKKVGVVSLTSSTETSILLDAYPSPSPKTTKITRRILFSPLMQGTILLHSITSQKVFLSITVLSTQRTSRRDLNSGSVSATLHSTYLPSRLMRFMVVLESSSEVSGKHSLCTQTFTACYSTRTKATERDLFCTTRFPVCPSVHISIPERYSNQHHDSSASDSLPLLSRWRRSWWKSVTLRRLILCLRDRHQYRSTSRQRSRAIVRSISIRCRRAT